MKKVEEMHGGAKREAIELRTNIQLLEDDIKIKGTIYYVSEHGDDKNTGNSISTPIKTISRINQLECSEGDAILFERGGLFRTEETLQIRSGITYGTYGLGSKPIISGSACNYAQDAIWTSTEYQNVWKTSVYGECGVMTFNDDTSFGVRKYSIEELSENEEYYHDLNNHELYLYSNNNPCEAYEQIEMGTLKDLLVGFHANDVTIHNLSFKYTANHAISLGDNRDIVIQGCEIGWIGGKIYNEKTGVRLGNGIQIWNECHRVKVDHCYIYQVYDAAFTFQGRYPEGNSYTDVEFTNCLIEYCSMNFEFWGSDQSPGNMDSGDLVEIKNILCKDNIFRFAGYGWSGVQRPDKGNQAFLLGWRYTYQPGKVSNFVICDNIFDTADCHFVWSELIFELQGNTYYQSDMSGRNSNVEIRRGLDIVAMDQNSFEEGIQTFDGKAKKIKWLQDKGRSSDYE